VSSALAREAAAGPLRLRTKVKLTGEILVTYVRARWWLRTKTLPEALELLRGAPLARVAPADADATLPHMEDRLSHAVVRTLSALPSDSRCLVRSLVLSSVLARRGVRSTLVIAVNSEPSFAAHAWVERDGLALLPEGDGGFKRILEI
jgi:Transglutaminase-like superfamily